MVASRKSNPSTVLVTGASSGIGQALARRLLNESCARVIICGRRAVVLERFRDSFKNPKIRSRICIVSFDVQDSNQVQAAIQSLPKNWQKIDVLVNNAGLALGLDRLQDGNPRDWDQMIDTNIKGLLYVTHAVLPFLRKSRRPHIVNLGSTAGKLAYAGGAVYCATKAAVDMLNNAMRVDYLPLGIKVTAIHPGAVETEFSTVRFKGDRERAKSVYRGFKPLSPDDVAATIAWVITQPAHVGINEVVMTPLAQANSVTFEKKF